MRVLLPLACLFLLLAACGSGADAPAGDATADGGQSDANAFDDLRVNGRVSGEAAYERFCIGCHETGLLDAPVVGNAADWEQVSKLWQAVVMEHAKQGYFEMPGKGGRPALPDAVVEAAVEYMLTITYPELPPDMR